MYDTDTKSGRILRRMIGDVNVFDLSGDIKGEQIQKIHDYLHAYVKGGYIQYAIINIQELNFIDYDSIARILKPLKDVREAVFFYRDESKADVFRSCKKLAVQKYCKSEQEVIELFGERLLNSKKRLDVGERRKAARMKSAIAAQFDCRRKDNDEVFSTTGIITNISINGAFIEYLDLVSASMINHIDFFKNVEVIIHAEDDFYGGQDICGEIVRVEISGRQTAIAVKFDQEIRLKE